MEGWVGLVGWPIADTLPITCQAVNHRSGKVRLTQTDVLTTAESRRQPEKAHGLTYLKRIYTKQQSQRETSIERVEQVSYRNAFYATTPHAKKCGWWANSTRGNGCFASADDVVDDGRENQSMLRSAHAPTCTADKGRPADRRGQVRDAETAVRALGDTCDGQPASIPPRALGHPAAGLVKFSPFFWGSGNIFTKYFAKYFNKKNSRRPSPRQSLKTFSFGQCDQKAVWNPL